MQAFVSTGQFVHDVMPGLMRGRTGYRVLLASYRDFGDIAADLQGDRCRGLEITTRGGNLDAFEWVEALSPNSAVAVAQMERQAADAQRRVTRATDSNERHDLAIVYLGLTGFDKALQYALGLKRRGTANRVAVLTCDCDETTKKERLGAADCREAFVSNILTPWCGGYTDFVQLAEGMTEVWPQVRTR